MDNISQEDFDKALSLMPEKKPEKIVTDEDIQEMLKQMQNPVNAQKEIAVQIKIFLDRRIDDEMEKNGYLGENTRKWIETYANILQKIQTSIHGDKSINLHVHKVTHGDVNAKIREASKIKILD